MTKVSVIVPNYNHEQYLPERLDSVFNQTFQDFEVILLDDGSSDGSVEILDEYAKKPKVSHFVVNRQNSRLPFSQWKRGIDLAGGEYIWIAESDDLADSRMLERFVQKLDTGVDLVYCRSLAIDENGEKIDDEFWPDQLDDSRWKKDFENSGLDEICNYLAYRNTIPSASACLFRKKTRLFTPAILSSRYSGDWLFWVRYLASADLAFFSGIMSCHRSHPGATRKEKDHESAQMRLKERLNAVRHARKVCSKGMITLQEAKKYKYLIRLIAGLKDSGRELPADLPADLLVYVYLYRLRNLFRSRQAPG